MTASRSLSPKRLVPRNSLPPRWGGRSLRLRVLLAVMVWVALGIGGIWFSATRLFAMHVEEQYHEELEVHVVELAGLVHVGKNGTLSLTRPLSDPRYLVPLSGFYWEVRADNGQSLRSASMTRGNLDERVAHSSNILHHIENGPTGPAITYGFAREIGGQDIHYMIATDRRLLDETIGSFTRELMIWMGVLAAALTATGVAIVAFGFRPLDRLTDAVSRLRNGDPTGLSGPFPSEIAPLVDDLNSYIAHTSRIVERGRVEAGNLAHALRTPLAVILDEAERLARDPATARSAAVQLQQAQRMVEQIEFRLARARSAAGAGVPGSISRLSQILPPILSAMRRLHPAITFRFNDALSDSATLPVDPVDLSELLSNLIDNAGKWAESTVEVALGGTEDDLIVTITDDGPGMTAQQIEQAGTIGLRFDETRPGAGLGLAIAHDIANTYGLDLTLSPRADGLPGLMVTVAP